MAWWPAGALLQTSALAMLGHPSPCCSSCMSSASPVVCNSCWHGKPPHVVQGVYVLRTQRCGTHRGHSFVQIQCLVCRHQFLDPVMQSAAQRKAGAAAEARHSHKPPAVDVDDLWPSRDQWAAAAAAAESACLSACMRACPRALAGLHCSWGCAYVCYSLAVFWHLLHEQMELLFWFTCHGI